MEDVVSGLGRLGRLGWRTPALIVLDSCSKFWRCTEHCVSGASGRFEKRAAQAFWWRHEGVRKFSLMVMQMLLKAFWSSEAAELLTA